MKKGFSFALLGCSGILFWTAGCTTELAQVPVGEEEKAWDKVLKENYYSFKPPRTPAPAFYRYQEKNPSDCISDSQTGTVATSDDPVAVIDRAAAGKTPVAGKPVVATKPVAGVKPVASVAVKTEPKHSDTPAVSKADGCKYSKPYIVENGDTLGQIAIRFYGNSSMEDVIFNANNKVITDRDRLRPGMRLVIPEL